MKKWTGRQAAVALVLWTAVNLGVGWAVYGGYQAVVEQGMTVDAATCEDIRELALRAECLDGNRE